LIALQPAQHSSIFIPGLGGGSARDQNRWHKQAPHSRNVLIACVESIEIDELRVVRMRIVQGGYATIG
jgi:hypothetical protein